MTMNPEPETVLYVEDEPDIQMVAKMALESLGGMSVVAFNSGIEAVSAMKDRHFTPDLILLDVMMPQLDGPGTMKQLQEFEHLKDVPVVFMTAKAQTHEIREFLALGAVSVIPKPFDPMTLVDQLREILKGRDT